MLLHCLLTAELGVGPKKLIVHHAASPESANLILGGSSSLCLSFSESNGVFS